MKKWSYIIIFFILIVVSVFFSWKIIASPQYSLKQLKKATPEHDVTAFNKYVDLDEVIDSIVVQTWQYYTSQEDTGNRWSEIRQKISTGLLSVVKPNLKEIIKKEVLDYVATGEWTDDNSKDNENSSLILKLIKNRIDPEKWDYQSINYAAINGETARIGLTYYDQSKETNFLVEINMRDMKGYWQLTEITNVAQLLNMFQNIDDITNS